MNPTDLPTGWTVRPTRFLYALVDPDGKEVSFGLTAEIAADAYWLKPEHGAITGSAKNASTFVDL